MMKRKWMTACLVTVMMGLTGCAGGSGNEGPETTTETLPAETTEAVTEAATTEAPNTEAPTTEEPTTEGPSYTPLESETEAELNFDNVRKQYEDAQESLAYVNKEARDKYNLPVIHVVTEDQKKVKKGEPYTASMVRIFNCDEEWQLTAEAGFRIRGNSTADSSPYPYRIKFDKKQAVLGLHEGEKYKSWVLLEPIWNLCPDYLAHQLAKTIFEGKYFVSDGCFVELYVNGKHVGQYYLCEQCQVAKGRIDVKEPKKDQLNPEVGYMVEMDNYGWDEKNTFVLDYHKRKMTDWQGEERKIPDDIFTVKSRVNSKEQMKFIENHMRGVYDIVYEACVNGVAKTLDENQKVVDAPDLTPQEAVEQWMDLESFIDMIILQELVQDYDVGAGNMNFAVDFSEGADIKRLTVMAPWDFNWGYSENPNRGYYASTWQTNQHDNYDRSNVWYVTLMTGEWFRDMVFARWTEISCSGQLDATLKQVKTYVERCRQGLGNEEWRVDKGKELCDYVAKRIKFLDKEWLRLEEDR